MAAAGVLVFSVAAVAAPTADPDRSKGIYVEGGYGDDSTTSASVGWIVPWVYGPSVASGPWSFYGDFFLSQWRADLPHDQGAHNYYQIGAIANWRYRFSQGQSPWFAEAGIGLTQMNDLFETPYKEFSTRFQFTEQIGIGRSFGDNGQHEVSLRFQHFSNARIRTPNPGEDFVRVRYVYRY